MNPNLLYSQASKGRFTGHSIGVIDLLHFAEVALGVEALRGSKALTPAEECWTLREACFARLVSDRGALADARRQLLEVHLPGQMAPDGSFPR